MKQIAVLALLACFLGGCNAYTKVSSTQTAVEQFRSNDALALGNDLLTSQSGKVQENKPINVLSLSGGGAWGAWGAGYLIGWRNHPSFPRPQQFDVVTGISTGGLQATAAFINDDSILIRGFTQVDQSDILRNRFPPYLAALWSPSLYDTEPLWKLIQNLYTNEVIDRVAEVSDHGKRRLIVAAGELDSGDLVFWDLSHIARSHQYDLYRSVCLATAAIPGAFPPVNIGGKWYVDGGSRASLFINQAMQPLLKLNPVDISVYVIVNGQTKLAPTTPTDRTLPVAFRAVSMVLAAQAWDDIREAYQFADEHHALFCLSSVPDDYVSHATAQFDRVEMNRLFDLGKATAQNNAINPWTFAYEQRPKFKAHEPEPSFASPAVQQSIQSAK